VQILKKGQRKWLLIGAGIYALGLLNGVRFVGSLPFWALLVGIRINLALCAGFLTIYMNIQEAD
jgi:hypothetical protein